MWFMALNGSQCIKVTMIETPAWITELIVLFIQIFSSSSLSLNYKNIIKLI